MERSFRSRYPSVGVDQDWVEKPVVSGPAHRLLTAIVRRAVWDFVLYREITVEEDPVRAGWAEDAGEWLFWDGAETTDAEGRLTFRHICELLDLNPKAFRTQVLKLTRDDIQRLNNEIKE